MPLIFLHSCFRSAYPMGLPKEFAFVAVLRMSGTTINKNWNIWQIQSGNGEEQLAVRLNGETKSLKFVFTVLNTGKQTVIFSQINSLFNDLWHNILLEVSRHSVTLFVDCHMINSEKTPAWQKVSLDGFTLSGMPKDNQLTAILVLLFYYLHFSILAIIRLISLQECYCIRIRNTSYYYRHLQTTPEYFC